MVIFGKFAADLSGGAASNDDDPNIPRCQFLSIVIHPGYFSTPISGD
jgi:hypothetical protein